jgi:phosphoribosylglycinamide formyltransferase-1
MEALVAAMAAPDYPATPVLLLTNRPDAGGLHGRAAQSVPALSIDHRPYRGDRAAHEGALLHALREAGAEIICLAGYMRILTPLLVGAYAGRMLNIHPSLLPLYPGLHTHERAIAAGDTRHGCTVHMVTDMMDEGPVVAQAEVPILPGDDPHTLAARVLVQEHSLYPRALASFIEGLRQ